MDFNKWYIELTGDERWLEVTKMHHKGKDFKDAAQKVYADGIADPLSFTCKPMAEHRRHVYNKLVKMAPMPVKIALQQDSKPQQQSEPVLVGEARQQKLNEWMRVIQNTPAAQRIRPMSHKEILENGDWKPKPKEIREPSEVEKLAALNAYRQKINNARRLFFLDAFPDAEEDEIEAYLNKFVL